MMGQQPPSDDSLFSYNVQLETRVRKDHPLRRVKEFVDFDFIYAEVRDAYGTTGHVSVPPPVILKLMFLLFFYDVRSERELMATLPERLDWLWFLGFTIETKIPDHSVLSKARRRWGEGAFRRFFERIVSRCVGAGLVDGTKVFIDASLIDANASKDSVISSLYDEFARRLDEHPYAKVNSGHFSTTDPDAALVRAHGESRPRYKTHRVVDPAHEVVAAVEVASGIVNEAHRLLPLLDDHEENTLIKADTVAADSKYGTTENFLACHEAKVNAHIKPLKETQKAGRIRKGIFQEEDFTYDAASDTFTCPAKEKLNRSSVHNDGFIYRASRKICKKCGLRASCTTTNKNGRTVTRHIRQDILDAMHARAESIKARRDIKARQHVMEGNFAHGIRFGMKNARWRRFCGISPSRSTSSARSRTSTSSSRISRNA